MLDDHSTHVENYEFIKHTIDHNIYLICFPSHSTYILQPLDVGIFGLFSTYYKQELEDPVCQQGPYGTIKKGDTFPMLQRARMKPFQPETIWSAWRACGLIPFNRNRILRDPICHGFDLARKRLHMTHGYESWGWDFICMGFVVFPCLTLVSHMMYDFRA